MKTANGQARTRSPKPASQLVLGGRRGNPNWGKPYPEMGIAVEPTAFEQLAKEHGIPEEAWMRSRILRDFARKNARHKYVPEALLEAWGIDSSDGGFSWS